MPQPLPYFGNQKLDLLSRRQVRIDGTAQVSNYLVPRCHFAACITKPIMLGLIVELNNGAFTVTELCPQDSLICGDHIHCLLEVLLGNFKEQPNIVSEQLT